MFLYSHYFSVLCDSTAASRSSVLENLHFCIYLENVLRSVKRDFKSANVNFEIVKYVVDDYLMNIKKKSRPKSTKLAELEYYEICCKKLHFEKNDFEIYEFNF